MIGGRNYHRNLVFCQSNWYLNIKVSIHFRREMLHGHYCQVYDYDVLIVSKTHIQKHKYPFLQDNKYFYVLHISYSIPSDSKLKQWHPGAMIQRQSGPITRVQSGNDQWKKNMKEDALIWSWKCCQRGGNTCKDQRNKDTTILLLQQLAQAQRP